MQFLGSVIPQYLDLQRIYVDREKNSWLVYLPAHILKQ